MTPRRRLGQCGFTLVELQIALLIVALMAVLMSGALRLAAKTWGAVNTQQDAVEHRYLLAQYLRRHLSSARFMSVTTEKYGSATGFFGNQTQINFVSPFPAFHHNGELYWWNFKLERDDEGNQYNLVASYFPYETNQPGRSDDFELSRHNLIEFDNDGGLYIKDIEPIQMLIAKNIADLTFEYFYRDEQGVQKWVDQWQPGTTTPLVIRINVVSASEIPGPGGETIYTAFPEILITPRYANQQLHSGVFESAQ